jgi:2-oxoglutarate ferredoxin oxidoreductase subunit gamma
MEIKVIISGFGGQGVMLLGQILAHAVVLEKRNVAFLQSYGNEMRGGTANCSVIISDEEIGSPIVEKAHYCIAMNIQSVDRFEPFLIRNGLLVLNSSLTPKKNKRQDVRVLRVPATEIASEIGSTLVANMVIFGAFIKVSKIVGLESVSLALSEVLPSHRHHFLPLNQKAIARGVQFVDLMKESRREYGKT